MNVSVVRTPGQRAEPIVHEVEQALVVLDHHFDEEVERPGGDHDVVDLGDAR